MALDAREKKPILLHVVQDPSAFGGPNTFKDIVTKNKYHAKYSEYVNKYNTLVFNMFRPPGNEVDEVIFHFQIRSSKDEGIIYDVILRFFAADNTVKTEGTIANYHIEVFSNSPGFAFNYAYVYNKYKRIPKVMINHFRAMELNTPPERSNPTRAIGYDYSVFFALYFLKVNNYLLDKRNIRLQGTNMSRFKPEDIATTKEVFRQRSGEGLGFKSLERKAKRTLKSASSTVKGVLGIGGGSKKATKAVKATKAKKGTSGTRKKGFFK